MIINVVLHPSYYSALTQFGELENVVNALLDACSAGEISVMDKPVCIPREGGQSYAINVVNDDYIKLVEEFGIRSSRISLRRFLYWVVDMEIYNEIKFDVRAGPIEDGLKKKKRLYLQRAINAIFELVSLDSNKSWRDLCKGVNEGLKNLMNLL